jgi:glycolate oxidase iron-sulfur subunit
MKHSIPIEKLGPEGKLMADAIEKCVHCGFCLPTCPTYTLLGEEMDSPRGRILLMKSVLEGNLALEPALPYIDRCLGCLGCVTACPSGVPYGELVTPFRAFAEAQRKRPLVKRASRRLTSETLPHPARFRLAASAGRLAQPLKAWLPEEFKAMLDLLPASLPPSQPLPAFYPAEGPRRGRVALLVGCVQQVLAPEINWATLRVLARNGVEVVIPPGQTCCGALALHTGDAPTARALAMQNMAAFPKDADAILTNAAGCGSGMHEYPALFTGTDQGAAAQAFAQRVEDVSVYLDRLGIVDPPAWPTGLQLAYHDACHLAHAQGITAAPRRLLERIPNLQLVAIPEGELCCGSAGSYNLDQPQIAGKLGERKAQNILASGAGAVAAGNIGCLVQIRNHLAALGQPLPVWHTLEVLDRAYHLPGNGK